MLLLVSGFMPFVAASARATITPAEPIEMTPIFFPLMSSMVSIGLGSGTAIP